MKHRFQNLQGGLGPEPPGGYPIIGGPKNGHGPPQGVQVPVIALAQQIVDWMVQCPDFLLEANGLAAQVAQRGSPASPKEAFIMAVLTELDGCQGRVKTMVKAEQARMVAEAAAVHAAGSGPAGEDQTPPAPAEPEPGP